MLRGEKLKLRSKSATSYTKACYGGMDAGGALVVCGPPGFPFFFGRCPVFGYRFPFVSRYCAFPCHGTALCGVSCVFVVLSFFSQISQL